MATALALPPRELQALVAGPTITDEVFLAKGALGVSLVLDMLARHGIELERSAAVLEWGCGCGRILRHWQDIDVAIHGCDYNPDLAEWCQQHLPFASVAHNRLTPPLPYDAESFDAVYAMSVFTHLSEAAHYHWMGEIHRVLKPGGVFLFTTKGDAKPFLDALHESEMPRFRAGELVVRSQGREGSNHVATWHPAPWVKENMLDGFELLEHAPHAAECVGFQDAWLVRRATSG